MKILAIETSCDETAMAVVEGLGGKKQPRFRILSDVVSSQISIHRPFGGVVPTLAKREHLKNLPVVLSKVKGQLSNVDLVAVTTGPGLEPALWTGINFAKDLGKELGIKVVGVNHLEGHIYSNWLKDKPKFPAICLIISGGHTILLLMKSIGKWQKLGETRDDAAGEAFDKVAKILGLPYPGGPEVERLARNYGRLPSIDFPRPMIHDKSYDFSFSGLKTAVLYYLRDHPISQRSNVKGQMSACVCASFQQAAIDVLVHKTLRAAREFKAKSILLCGGVACNQALQHNLRSNVKGQMSNVGFFVPNKKFNTDNAVMIAAAAYLGKHYPVTKALSNLNL